MTSEANGLFMATIDAEQFLLETEAEWQKLRADIADLTQSGGGWVTIQGRQVSVDVLVNSSTRARLTRSDSVATRQDGVLDRMTNVTTYSDGSRL